MTQELSFDPVDFLKAYWEDQKATLIKARKLILDESADPAERIQAIRDVEYIEAELFAKRLKQIEKKYTPQVLTQMIRSEIEFRLRRLKEMRDQEYKDNDERRSKGVPFSERQKQLNHFKLKWCDERERLLEDHLQSLRSVPIAQWFTQSDYESAKRMGMEFIIKFNLEWIYVTG